jgi:hypothetical protein
MTASRRARAKYRLTECEPCLRKPVSSMIHRDRNDTVMPRRDRAHPAVGSVRTARSDHGLSARRCVPICSKYAHARRWARSRCVLAVRRMIRAVEAANGASVRSAPRSVLRYPLFDGARVVSHADEYREFSTVHAAARARRSARVREQSRRRVARSLARAGDRRERVAVCGARARERRGVGHGRLARGDARRDRATGARGRGAQRLLRRHAPDGRRDVGADAARRGDGTRRRLPAHDPMVPARDHAERARARHAALRGGRVGENGRDGRELHHRGLGRHTRDLHRHRERRAECRPGYRRRRGRCAQRRSEGCAGRLRRGDEDGAHKLLHRAPAFR